jgi:adenylyl-sulfate kinase
MKPCVVWITGLSGAGKTTLSNELNSLLSPTFKVKQIDGDDLRKEKPKLGFSYHDRLSNAYHATHDALSFIDKGGGDIAIISLISPYKQIREDVRQLVEKYSKAVFIEVFLDTPIEICEQRDPKGLYKKARNGEINNFTGIHEKYEEPQAPDIWLPQRNPFYGELTVDKCAKIIYSYISNL